MARLREGEKPSLSHTDPSDRYPICSLNLVISVTAIVGRLRT